MWLSVTLVISSLGFGGWVWVLVASVPGLCGFLPLKSTHNLFFWHNEINHFFFHLKIVFFTAVKMSAYYLGLFR